MNSFRSRLDRATVRSRLLSHPYMKHSRTGAEHPVTLAYSVEAAAGALNRLAAACGAQLGSLSSAMEVLRSATDELRLISSGGPWTASGSSEAGQPSIAASGDKMTSDALGEAVSQPGSHGLRKARLSVPSAPWVKQREPGRKKPGKRRHNG